MIEFPYKLAKKLRKQPNCPECRGLGQISVGWTSGYGSTVAGEKFEACTECVGIGKELSVEDRDDLNLLAAIYRFMQN